ncbi:MAG TPA: DUF2848 domain-containing protein [Castellaniella sp.]|uniref:DUF2848 domain-containing protein n=1 Tax=Castellaniella sp. TaxID=1955812 RepID=UPI002F17A4A4
MKLSFNLINKNGGGSPVVEDITQCVIAGWAGRDRAAIEHHIEELAAIGVPRPSAVPLYYRVAANQLTQEPEIQVVGTGSSGEAEAFVFTHQGTLLVSIASDHTDRTLEAHSVALSKQICVKPVAHDAWEFDSVKGHWDQLVLRSWIEERGDVVLYQEGSMDQLSRPEDLIQQGFSAPTLPPGTGMTCGTVTVRGSIRPASEFTMELHDPVLKRSIRHRYTVTMLPEIA